MPTEKDKGKRFPPDPMVTERRSPADLLPSLGRLARKEERKRDKQGLGSLWLKFKFEFESFKLGLKN
jgi:hypothetical protein